MTKFSPQSITFEEAIDRSETCLRHVLLGNGFSINARPSFRYEYLFEKAPSLSAEVAAIFQDRGTKDFEEVLDLVRRQDLDASNELCRSQDEEVRSAFLGALSAVHPHSSAFISRDEVDRCAAFLEHFVGLKRSPKLRGRVYTTNYDLLLYWVVVRTERRLWCYDNHEGKPYGVWNPEKNPSLVYLHGALHLYDTSKGQIMLRFDGQHSLIDQTRTRLNEGRFPVIVAEGTSEAKVARIQQSKYLKRMSRYLMTGFKDENAVLFTYGHSFSDRDAHLLKLVGEGQIKTVYVGAYGGMDGPQNQAIHDWTMTWAAARQNRGEAPEVWVYDTATFSPWR